MTTFISNNSENFQENETKVYFNVTNEKNSYEKREENFSIDNFTNSQNNFTKSIENDLKANINNLIIEKSSKNLNITSKDIKSNHLSEQNNLNNQINYKTNDSLIKSNNESINEPNIQPNKLNNEFQESSTSSNEINFDDGESLEALTNIIFKKELNRNQKTYSPNSNTSSPIESLLSDSTSNQISSKTFNNNSKNEHLETHSTPKSNTKSPSSFSPKLNSINVSPRDFRFDQQVPILSDKYNKATERIAMNSERIDHLMESLRNLNLSKQRLDKKLIIQENQIREQQGLRSVLDEVSEKLAHAEQRILELDQQVNNSIELTELRQKKKDLKNKISQLENKIKIQEEDNHQLSDKLFKSLNNEILLQQSIQSLTNKNNEAQEIILSLKARENELLQVIEKINMEKIIAVKAYQHLKTTQK